MVSANYEYTCSNTENLPLPIQIKLSKKKGTFFDISLEFWYVLEISNVLKKK